MKYINIFFQELFVLLNDMSPYLLFGFLLAGILHVYFPRQKVIKYLGQNNFRSVLVASLIGVPLPLCSCGVIPTGVGFYREGASKGATVSFLISTPQTGVDSIFVTYSMLGLPFAILRPFIAFITGIFGGVLTNASEKKKTQNVDIKDEISEKSNMHPFLRMLKYGFVDFMQDLSKYLIIGLLLAALIAVIVPDDFFTTYVSNQYMEMLIVLAVAVPLYVCATGSIPIAMVLLMKGMSPGAALVFMMAGPATNAATITVLSKVLGKKTFLIYLISIITGAIFFGIIINNFLPSEWFYMMNHAEGHSHNEILPGWVGISSTIIMIGLIINGYIQKYLQKNKKQEVVEQINTVEIMKTLKINVKGMTCNHCKANVEKNISKIEGIKTVKADITSEMVEISGDEIDENEIEKLVNELGYEYNGKVN